MNEPYYQDDRSTDVYMNISFRPNLSSLYCALVAGVAVVMIILNNLRTAQALASDEI